MILDTGLVIINTDHILFLFLKKQRINPWVQQTFDKLCWEKLFLQACQPSVQGGRRGGWHRAGSCSLLHEYTLSQPHMKPEIKFCSWKKSEKEILNTKFHKKPKAKKDIVVCFDSSDEINTSINSKGWKRQTQKTKTKKSRLLGKRAGRKGQKEMNRS